MSKIKVAVARPLPDEEALWRGDAQAVQGDVDDFGLAKEKPHLKKEAAWRTAAGADTAAAGAAVMAEPPQSRRQGRGVEHTDILQVTAA